MLNALCEFSWKSKIPRSKSMKLSDRQNNPRQIIEKSMTPVLIEMSLVRVQIQKYSSYRNSVYVIGDMGGVKEKVTNFAKRKSDITHQKTNQISF